MIVSAFPGTLLLSQCIATKAIPRKTGINHIPVISEKLEMIWRFLGKMFLLFIMAAPHGLIHRQVGTTADKLGIV